MPLPLNCWSKHFYSQFRALCLKQLNQVYVFSKYLWLKWLSKDVGMCFILEENFPPYNMNQLFFSLG